ncbi:hypothetical protein [Pseudodesulfovibrio sp.]|uniref:hypothetical protein n=1 Tax=Pseudodesulfovibrio sp. TaxID=2035812 RepID=UPI00261AC231|nr:hypothetical protein [Pseudodesulfovibrio sp.]MDD3312898.1 hypothetical protein [Pseudodesulfovibrio sp.]
MRKGRETLNNLLRTAHRDRETPTLPRDWHDSVMADVSRLGPAGTVGELERLAPRFALTAAAVLVTFALAGYWALGTLPGDIRAAYSTSEFSVVMSQPWQNL